MADEKVVLDGDLSLRNVLDGDLSLKNVLDGIAGTVIRVEVEIGLDYIVFNNDYTLTFVMTNGEQYTTGSIRGAQGERGVSGVYIGDDEPADEDMNLWIDTDASDEIIDVKDVQVNGTSVVQDGVADIPVANNNNKLGVVTVDGGAYGFYGITNTNGVLRTSPADLTIIKGGSNTHRPIDPAHQHQSTFYGLAKAAGDTTQSQSDNSVGTYTDEAKTAIRTMLGLQDLYDDYSSALEALGVI